MNSTIDNKFTHYSENAGRSRIPFIKNYVFFALFLMAEKGLMVDVVTKM